MIGVLVMRRIVWGGAVGLALLATPLLACLWDRDTLQMEQRRFPSALNLITGKFLRHSPEFYEWRIENRRERLKTTKDDPQLLDDLAVAYDKTGQHQLAIDTMRDKETRFPGLYETYANLGTFHIHSGDLEEGLTWIAKAIAINPDAHFGREIYQDLLVRYVISKRVPGSQQLDLPLGSGGGFHSNGDTFASFLDEQHADQAQQQSQDSRAAVKGILGMMRFGHYDSPVLLEALGDLLLAKFTDDAKRLAARAYLKASYEADQPAAQSAYRKFAKEALSLQTRTKNTTQALDLATLEKQFRSELKNADAWYAAVRADERNWIDSGEDADLKFSQKYYRPPTAGVPQPSAAQSLRSAVNRWSTSIIVGVCCLLVVSMGLLGVRRRKQTH